MKFKNRLKVLLLISGLTGILAFSNDEQLDKLLKNLEQLATTAPQEKVHLQLDKPYYSLGEDIWLKAYVVNAEDNTLSGRSKILYVDLLDERDSVKKTLLLPLVNGTADANISLPDSLMSTGNYHIYAYTKWMQNFSSDFFFKKTIPVVNALKGAVTGELEYKAVMSDNGKQLTGNITYKKDNGTTYGGLLVNYTIKTGNKVIFTGKATTDPNGKLAITNNIKKDHKDSVISISTTADLPAGHVAKQNFVIRPLAGTADVQFFPEGGQMVEGIRTKVAFKAVKPDGMSESISGYIADESNEQVAMLNTEHAGMGIFALMPISGKTYTAVIKHEDGSESRHPLPKAQSSGYVLNVNRVGQDSLSVRVSSSKALATGGEATLIAQTNGVVQLVAKAKLDGASTVSIISTKKFPTGITQITLFSPEYAPVAERLVFVDHNDQLSAEVKPDKPSYAKREKVKLDLKVTDANGSPVIGSFSMAVTDGTKVKQDEDNETTILSNLLLTSDIKGFVERPNYYFDTNNPDRQKHLDQLLLTQGWRRFTWADVAAAKLPVINYQPEQSLSVTGSITTMGNKPLANSKVNLFAKTANGPMIADTLTDANGHFVFNELDFADSAKLVIRASNAKGKTTVKTNIDRRPRVRYAPIFYPENAVRGTTLSDYLKYTQEQFTELSKFGLIPNATALKEVTINAKKIPFWADKVIPHSANKTPGSADLVMKPDKLKRYSTIQQALQGFGVPLTRGVKSITGSPAMMVLLDGQEIAESSVVTDIIEHMSPNDLVGIEIIRSARAVGEYGPQAINGVVILTTKHGDDDIMPDLPSTHIQRYVPQGYATTKQFYAPKYDTPTKNEKMTDLRSTIHWEPNMVTDAEGKKSSSYFNADGTGTYRIVIEGMDTKGKLLRKVITYAVK